jgi:NAD-dependent dihydropyrimidine dehydrogenase PreA subunit
MMIAMTAGRTARQSHVVFCRCVHYDIIAQASKQQILNSLQKTGVSVEVVSDLCGLAAHRDPLLEQWVQAESLVIVACFPRAVRWLFHVAGTPLSDGTAHLFNMRTQRPEEIVAQISNLKSQIADSRSGADSQSAIDNPESEWVPWFPVIDYDRCKNCKQCLNFCLFGVYGLSEDDRVEVVKPSGCKTNCPACARMCPAQAIIFPKYADPPINGDQPDERVSSSSKRADPLSGLSQGDLHEALRRRGVGRKRFSTDPNDRSCPTLDALRKELGIPKEVLTSLSPGELQRLGRPVGRQDSRTPDSSSQEGDQQRDKEGADE